MITLLAVAGSADLARATPHVPKEQLVERPGQPAHLRSPSLLRAEPIDALDRLARAMEFQKKMQSTTCEGNGARPAPGSSDGGVSCPDGGAPREGGVPEGCQTGGQIEVETGAGSLLIESDNTQEAVWGWNFFQRLGGGHNYDAMVQAAFAYLDRFPGYDEWKGDICAPGPDYYSLYNCGWGLRAILEYERATGDHSRHSYGDLCAQHIVQYGPSHRKDLLVDAAAAGWAASGLWLWGQAQCDPALKQTAAAIGQELKDWIGGSRDRLAMRAWAVTGGAVFHAVVHTYMKEHPDELVPWAQEVAPRLGGWIDESVRTFPNDWHDWRNAQNGWNMLAQFTASEVLGGEVGAMHRAVALDILGKLVAQDTDNDGGIPGSLQRPATEDQSWITSYLAYFGMRPLLEPEAHGAAPACRKTTEEGGCSLSASRHRIGWGSFVLSILAVLALTVRMRSRRPRRSPRSASRS